MICKGDGRVSVSKHAFWPPGRATAPAQLQLFSRVLQRCLLSLSLHFLRFIGRSVPRVNEFLLPFPGGSYFLFLIVRKGR